MTEFVRRLVSGNKARFKDHKLNLELDLVYITDQIIIMGYPAAGVQGLYRNRRQDAKRFLDTRHGVNYWVFNFCPIVENSYPKSVFGGRVSRYPFPDHHAPPLAIIPLAVREIQKWLSGSSERVAVLHCKAGKGRSGTLACAYLLSLDDTPVPPRLERSYNAKQWAKIRAEDVMRVMPPDAEDPAAEQPPPEAGVEEGGGVGGGGGDAEVDSDAEKKTSEALVANTALANTPAAKVPTPADTLRTVLELHTSRRMRPSSPASAPSSTPPNLSTTPSSTLSNPSLSPISALPSLFLTRTNSILGKGKKEDGVGGEIKKQPQGVSIPSQRRWLFYWALLLAGEAPAGFWGLEGAPEPELTKKRMVRLTQVRIRMRQQTTLKAGLIKAASALVDRGRGWAAATEKKTQTGNSTPNKSRDGGSSMGIGDTPPVWISLARYADPFVERLEQWEKSTRVEGPVGRGSMGRMSGAASKGVPEGVTSSDTEIENATTEEEKDEVGDDEKLVREMFAGSRWDGEKMVRRFAKMGCVGTSTAAAAATADVADGGSNAGTATTPEVPGKVVLYTLEVNGSTPIISAAAPAPAGRAGSGSSTDAKIGAGVGVGASSVWDVVRETGGIGSVPGVGNTVESQENGDTREEEEEPVTEKNQNQDISIPLPPTLLLPESESESDEPGSYSRSYSPPNAESSKPEPGPDPEADSEGSGRPLRSSIGSSFVSVSTADVRDMHVYGSGGEESGRSDGGGGGGVGGKEAEENKVEEGVLLDACREVRVKLYMGQIPMGWLWFIPIFHMPTPPPPTSTSTTTTGANANANANTTTNFTLTRAEVDFPLGIGKDLLDIEMVLQWV